MHEWENSALCATFPDVNFVPDPLLREDSQPAKLVCTHCTVQVQCAARGYLELGIWGGMDELERLRIRVQDRDRCGCGGYFVYTSFDRVCLRCGDIDA